MQEDHGNLALEFACLLEVVLLQIIQAVDLQCINHLFNNETRVMTAVGNSTHDSYTADGGKINEKIVQPRAGFEQVFYRVVH